MSSDDLCYLRGSAAEERRRALIAASPDVRVMHLDLVSHYDQASGKVDNAEHMRSSREAVKRSLKLLAQTSRQLRDE